MNDVLVCLGQRKLVQWALAYLAAAWVALQVPGLAVDSYEWPYGFMRVGFGQSRRLSWRGQVRSARRLQQECGGRLRMHAMTR